MAKNIVICCDGTGNTFGDTNTNVAKLARILMQDPAWRKALHRERIAHSRDSSRAAAAPR